MIDLHNKVLNIALMLLFPISNITTLMSPQITPSHYGSISFPSLHHCFSWTCQKDPYPYYHHLLQNGLFCQVFPYPYRLHFLHSALMVPIAESSPNIGMENLQILGRVAGKLLVLFTLNLLFQMGLISSRTLGITTFKFLLDLDTSGDIQGLGEDIPQQCALIPRVIKSSGDPQLKDFFPSIGDIGFFAVSCCKSKAESVVIYQSISGT